MNVDIPDTKSLAVVVTPEITRSPNTVAPNPVVSILFVLSSYSSIPPSSVNFAKVSPAVELLVKL